YQYWHCSPPGLRKRYPRRDERHFHGRDGAELRRIHDCLSAAAADRKVLAESRRPPLTPNVSFRQLRTSRCICSPPPWPSRPGEFPPEPLTDPDLNLSIHPARATARRLPPSIDYRVPPVAG